MQDQAEGRAGINGSGTGYAAPPFPGPGGGVAGTDDGEAGRRSGAARLDAIMADAAERAALERRITGSAESLRSIARSIAVERETLRRRMRDEGWTRPKGTPKARAAEGSAATAGRRLASTMADAGIVRARMLRAIDRQVGKINARLKRQDAEIEERDSRILGNLAKTLSALVGIGEGGKTSKDREPPDRDDAEDRLAERIKRWARGGE